MGAEERFLGKGQRVHDVGIVPKYYGELLTWALKRYMDKEVPVLAVGHFTRRCAPGAE